jgi:transposase
LAGLTGSRRRAGSALREGPTASGSFSSVSPRNLGTAFDEPGAEFRARDCSAPFTGELYLEAAVATLSARIEAVLAPFSDALQRLETIPGVNQRTAEVLIAEIGVDMNRFPSDRHLASWAGLCPGNHESAGKHRTGKTRKGNIWLRAALVEAALGATRTKNSAVAARYRRILRHRGHKKAIVAVAHNLLVTAYHVLASQTTYHELGADYYDRRHTERVAQRAVQTLEQQGYRVTLERVA